MRLQPYIGFDNKPPLLYHIFHIYEKQSPSVAQSFLNLIVTLCQSAFSWHVAERAAIKLPENESHIADKATHFLCILHRVGRSLFGREESKGEKVTRNF
jgi:hypothetical protein